MYLFIFGGIFVKFKNFRAIHQKWKFSTPSPQPKK